MWGAIASVAGNLLGGLFGSNAQDKANEANQQNALRQEALQREFAQNSIQWKAEDAKKAGIHPLYALGANTTSYQPHSVGEVADTSMANAFAKSGQDLSRAINTTRTGEQRDDAYTKTVQGLTLQKFGLENELLATQVAKLRATPNPPMPSIGPIGYDPKGPEAAPHLYAGGPNKIEHDPSVSNVEDYTKRYGEPADWLMGPYVAWKDFNYHNRNQPSAHVTTRARFGNPPAWLRELTGEGATFAERWKGR